MNNIVFAAIESLFETMKERGAPAKGYLKISIEIEGRDEAHPESEVKARWYAELDRPVGKIEETEKEDQPEQ